MTLADWADIATISGGVVAVVGLVFAIWQVLAWKRQRRSEMRSIAARDALVALTRAHDVLVAWTTTLEDLTDVEDPDMDFERLFEEFAGLDRRGREAMDQPLRDLHAATAEAYVHLDNEEAGFLSTLHSLALEMREDIDGRVTEMEQVPSEETLASVRRLHRALHEDQEFIQQQLQRAASVLQPIARLTK
jgi:hypothetical protein